MTPAPALLFLFSFIISSAFFMFFLYPAFFLCEIPFPDTPLSELPSGLPTLLIALSIMSFSLFPFRPLLSALLATISSYFAPPNIASPVITIPAACASPMKALSVEYPSPEPVTMAMAIIPMFSMTCDSMKSITASAAIACMLLPPATRFMT